MEHQIRPDVCRKLGLIHDDYQTSDAEKFIPITLDQYKEAVRVKIAELEGWKLWGGSTNLDTRWARPDRPGDFDIRNEPPDYCHDLNACHEWEEKLKQDFDKWEAYTQSLIQVALGTSTIGQIPATIGGVGLVAHSTALQRCEARILMES